jgi:DNA-binding NarL/FixJ family response regulator
MVPRTGPTPGQSASRSNIETLREAPPTVPAKARRVNGEALFADPQATAIIVIDQRLLIRDCLVKCLREIDIGCTVLAFASITECLEASAQYVPLLFLLSLQPQNCDDSEFQQNLSLLNRNKANAPVIIISDSEDISSVVSILKSGARGYIPTSVTLKVALEAMRLVGAGGTFAPTNILLDASTPSAVTAAQYNVCKKAVFTARQLAVLVALRRGKANKQIAYELNMREGTVKVHVRHIMKKLHARNRTEVAVIANDMFATPNVVS